MSFEDIDQKTARDCNKFRADLLAAQADNKRLREALSRADAALMYSSSSAALIVNKALSTQFTPDLLREHDARLVEAERERICAAIKAEDDHCADGDYMMDSDDCIKVVLGTWKRPDWNGSN